MNNADRQQEMQMQTYEQLALSIRLALYPHEPGRILAFVTLAESLAESRHDSWRILERTFQTLLACTNDPLLPFAWRVTCLDYAYRPLKELSALPGNPWRRNRLRQLGYRLTTVKLFEAG